MYFSFRAQQCNPDFMDTDWIRGSAWPCYHESAEIQVFEACAHLVGVPVTLSSGMTKSADILMEGHHCTFPQSQSHT